MEKISHKYSEQGCGSSIPQNCAWVRMSPAPAQLAPGTLSILHCHLACRGILSCPGCLPGWAVSSTGYCGWGGTWAWPWCATEWWALLNRVAGFCHLVHLRAECRFCWSMLLHHFKSWTYISSAADYVVNPLVKSVWWVWHSLCSWFVCLWMSCATVPFFSSRLLLPCSLPILL